MPFHAVMQSPFLDPWLGCIGRATHQHVQEGKESHQGPDSSSCLRWLGWPAATWPRGFCFWDFAAAYVSNVSGCVCIHLQLCGMSSSGTFTMTLVRVLTGRRHQIRSHCMQIGHPTVSDGRYTSTATFQTDTAFCPRNFLHRPGKAKSTYL